MEAFTNPDNLVVPNEGYTRTCIDKYNEMTKTNTEISKEIDIYENKIRELEKQRSNVIDDIRVLKGEMQDIKESQELLMQQIVVFQVDIQHVEDTFRVFSELSAASDFKRGLVKAGVHPDHVSIELAKVDDIDEIDKHKNPDLFGYLYDTEHIYKRYRCEVNQAKKRGHEDDS